MALAVRRTDSVLNTRNRDGDEAIESELSAITSDQFQLANLPRPERFLSTVFSEENAAPPLKFAHGTTTLAFVFQHGIVVAVDSRSTQGPFIASQSVQKVIAITPYLLGTMAGGAADCQYWERELGRRCRLFELRHKKRITVAAASRLLANIVYYYRGYGLSMGTMVAGWDHTGPNLHYVDSDGQHLKNNRFSVGSGSTYAYGVLDSGYRHDLSIDEACELGRRAIHHATHRDAYSGGTINVFLVEKAGWRKISQDDTNDLYWERYSLEQ